MTITLAQGPGWALVNGDALIELPKMPAHSVDAVITDPPYSSGGAFRSDRTPSTKSKYTAELDYGDFHGDARDQRGFLAWCSMWFAETWRIAREGAMICTFIDWRMLPTVTDAMQVGGWIWRGVAPWRKRSARRMLGRFCHECEYVLWGSKGPIAVERGVGALGGFFDYLPVHHIGRVHQSEKPIELMRDLMQVVVPGGVVLDPFAGSGTTLLAAVQTGRTAIGIELSPAHADEARAKLEAAADLTTAASTKAGQIGLFSSREDDFG